MEKLKKIVSLVVIVLLAPLSLLRWWSNLQQNNTVVSLKKIILILMFTIGTPIAILAGWLEQDEMDFTNMSDATGGERFDYYREGDEATYTMEYAWKAVNFEDIEVFKKTKVHFEIDTLPMYGLDFVVFHKGKQMKHVSLDLDREGTITLPKGEYKLFLDAPKKETNFTLTLNFKGDYRLSGYQGNRRH